MSVESATCPHDLQTLTMGLSVRCSCVRCALYPRSTAQAGWNGCSSQVIYVVGVLKKRLTIPQHSPQVLRSLIPACWQDDPDLRPTFQALFPLLQVQRMQSLSDGGGKTLCI